MEDILNALFRALWRALKGLLSLSLMTSLMGCKEGASSAGNPSSRPDGGPTAVTLLIQSGSGFDCFMWDNSVLYCRGTPTNNDLRSLFNSPTFVPVASGNLVNMWHWDDTLCVGAIVSQRPLSRTAGEATYCWGEATLNSSYAMFPIVYSGPFYSHAANGSPDVTYAQTPFVGADLNVIYFATQTATAQPIVSDGSGSVTQSFVYCSYASGHLICPDFTLEVL